MTLRGDWTLEELRLGLNGSPYSVPHEGDRAASEMLDQMRLVTADATTALHNLHRSYRSRFLRRNRTSEIHESNRVEGLGPEFLAETFEILNSKQATEIDEAIHRYAVIKSIDADQRTMDVLGLHGAKTFADQLRRSDETGLTESDVRSIHGLLMGRDPDGGRYKIWLNRIAESKHTPLPPSDTPEAMHNLITWMNRVVETRCLPAPVAAAAVHAWLAHIHPFHDGNGRVARLLANLIVGREGLPPLVIEHVSDRHDYITALQISDEGGDLAPLVGVFLKVMNRAVQLLREPDFALRLFEDEIQARVKSAYTQWRQSTLQWFDLFGAALTLHGLQLRTDPNELLDQGGFQRIRKLGSRSDALVVGGIGNESRYPHCRAYLLLEPTRNLFRFADGNPTLTFLVYGPIPWSTRVHQRMGGEVDEVLIKPDPSDGVLVRTKSGRTTRLNPSEAAEMVASHISQDFRSGRARARYS
ncbi:Fic family protein [uncultured Aeromicrobium sp.]|uniref:Fic family protein n=1 Tax=uncultured Aeromicrobium sp. TaxID=337820 RepID=UPI0025F92296|nr:Fic family protein [uncultured Aeromicrobium sp.]